MLNDVTRAFLQDQDQDPRTKHCLFYFRPGCSRGGLSASGKLRDGRRRVRVWRVLSQHQPGTLPAVASGGYCTGARVNPRVPGSARSAETTVRLLSQLSVTPSVQDSRETVRIIIIIIITVVVVIVVVVVVHLLGNVYSHKVKYAHR